MHTPRPGPTRRQFLATVIAGAVAASCSSSDDDAGGNGNGGADGTTTAPTTATTLPVPDLPDDPFTLGVASGDPLPTAVILWTRIAPDPLTGGGMPDVDVPVTWELATDDTFDDIVATGTTTATPALAHSVHVDATDLTPDTWYTYRFRVGPHTSPTGRTRTAPATDADVASLALAVTTCQDYGSGRYAAYRHLAAEEDLDLVVFVGDYIYEFPGVDDPEEALAEHRHLGEPVDLASYRVRYAQYHLDPDLAAAHARCPWVLMWDDHEVANNYARDIPDGATEADPAFAERRLAAYQSFWEHQPLRLPRPESTDVELWQELAWGTLADLFVVDERSQSDPVPCRDTSIGDVGPICDEALAEDRSNLGATQEAWLLDGLAATTATWPVLVSPVLMAGLDLSEPGDDPPRHFLELWDGYPAARRRVASALGEHPGAIVVSGDFHAAFAAEVRPDPWQADEPVAAVEFCTPAISSVLFDPVITARNPHIRYFEAAHGYLWCRATPEAWDAEFRYVEDVTDAASPVTVAARFRVPAGTTDLEQL